MDARTFLADLFFVAVFFAEEEEVGGKSSDMFRFRQCVVGLGLVFGDADFIGGLCLCCVRKTHWDKINYSVVLVSSIIYTTIKHTGVSILCAD